MQLWPITHLLLLATRTLASFPLQSTAARSSAALATLSPSSVDSLTSSATSYGLEDISLAPFVLVATLDGRIHRLDRTTGELSWTTEPLLDSQGKEPAMVWAESDDSDVERFVVEGRDGDIWVGTQEVNSWNWRRLGANVPALVQASFQSSPIHFRRDHDPSRYFTGTISTSTFSLALESGRIVDEIDVTSEEASIRPVTDLLDELEDGMLTGSDTLQITRHDYTLRIHNPVTPSSTCRRPRVQTLHFSSFTNPDPSSPNPFPALLSRRTPDGWYATLFKGSGQEGSAVLGLRDLAAVEGVGEGFSGLVWGTKISGTPIAFYDVLQVRDPSILRPSAPFIRPQPLHPQSTLARSPNPTLPLPDLERPLLVIEPTNNSSLSPFFALSQRNYPLFGLENASAETSSSFKGVHVLKDRAWEEWGSGKDRPLLGIEGPKVEVAALSEEVKAGASLTTNPSPELPRLLWSILLWGTCTLTIVLCFIFFRPSPMSQVVTVIPSQTPSHPPSLSSSPSSAKPFNSDPLDQSHLNPIPECEPDRVGARKRRRRPRRKKAGDQEGEDDAEVDGDVDVEAEGDAELKLDGTEVTIVHPGQLSSDGGVSSVSGNLIVSDKLIGMGSGGTCVFEGSFQTRPVAVKRLLSQFATLHSHEVSLLRASDGSPHVVRYFLEHASGPWLYIALELCDASLCDLIERPKELPELQELFDPLDALRGMSGGLNHLHSLKICHRDLTPRNVLVSRNKHQSMLVFKLSDFGLAKLVPHDQSTFTQTAATGTVGWRAPECLLDDGGGSGDPSDWEVVGKTEMIESGIAASSRLTSAIDVWSAGNIFFYTVTGGRHPFGERFDRERNVCRGKSNLDRLDVLNEGRLLRALISRMISLEPRNRPTISEVLLAPLFWTSSTRLSFLLDASDAFESMSRDPPDPILVELEEQSREVLGDGWMSRFDSRFIDSLGKYRKYGSGSVRDLLRAIRNKRHHFLDIEPELREAMSPLPHGFLAFFLSRFPLLFLHVYQVVQASRLKEEPAFRVYFDP